MQEIITRELCDLCFHIDGAEIKREAEFKKQLSMGRKTYELSWCEDHNGKSWTLEEMFEFFEQYGVVVDTGKAPGLGSKDQPSRPGSRKGMTAPSTKRYPCEHCGVVFKRIDYHEAHLYKKHGIGNPPVMEQCDFPGCTVIRERKRGLGNHKRRAHGVMGIQNHRGENLPAIQKHNARLYEEARKALK